jgi:hypothetical protein
MAIEPVDSVPLDPITLRRLRLFRTLTIIAPWLVLVAFMPLHVRAPEQLPYATGFPDRERSALTAFWFVSGAISVLAWVFTRRSPRFAGTAALLSYVLAMWVALLGAGAWGRGAPFSWFAVTYAWAIAVVIALFPLRVRKTK